MIDAQTPLLGPVEVPAAAIVDQVVRARAEAPAYELARVERIAAAVVRYGAAFGMRAAIVAGQIMHETGWLRFGGDVDPGQLNLAGLGATGGGVRGASFVDEDQAVAAVYAHHAVYVWGSVERWPVDLRRYAALDPRYAAVLSAGLGGSVRTLGDYRGKWAAGYPQSGSGSDYPERVAAAANRMLEASMGYPISRLVDVRGELHTNPEGGPRQQVALADKRGVIVHYNGPPTTQDDRALLLADSAYHCSKDWGDGSGPPVRGDGLMYHLAVGQDGTRYLCRNLEAVLWHCGAWPENAVTLSVLVPIGGEEHATGEQLASLRDLVDEWIAAGHGGRADVKGHRRWRRRAAQGR